MSSSKYKFTDSTLSSGEVGSEGANEFWKKTIRYFG